MTERDRLFLEHILAAITDIEAFTTEGRVGFMADRKTQSAVVRQLEIVGEAVKNLSPAITASETAVPWRLIAGAPVRAVAHESAAGDRVTSLVERRHAGAPRPRDAARRTGGDERVGAEQQRIRPAQRDLGQPGIDLAFAAGIDDVQADTAARANACDPSTCSRADGVFGLTISATCLACGTSSRSSSKRLGIRSAVRKMMPVALPPGRARLWTTPSRTGSPPIVKTMGIFLLAMRRPRPAEDSAGTGLDESATDAHSITSSARSSSDCGIARPSARAVLRLMTSSKRVGWTIGSSAGLSPLRTRAAYAPACRHTPAKSVP